MPPQSLAAALAAGALLLAPAAAHAASVRPFPSERLYPHYTADPRSPEFGMALLRVADPEVPDSGASRVGLKLGGRFGLVRLRWLAARHPRGLPRPVRPRALARQHRLGRPLRLPRQPAVGERPRLPARHQTRLRPRRRRVRRAHRAPAPRLYPRGGRGRPGVERRPRRAALRRSGVELQGQAGARPGARAPAGRRRAAPPVPVARAARLVRGRQPGGDAGAGLAPRFELHLGLSVPAGDRRWRLGVALYDGRMPLGELFRFDESSVAVGLWLEP